MDAELRDRWLTHASDRIARVGLRSGAARSAIVELLASEGQCLVTAQDITDLLRERQVGSPASVYRALDELSKLGLLHRMEGRDGVARFEIADPDHEHQHHHFVDENTGVVEAFTDDALERAIEGVAERLNLQLTGHEVVLRGSRATHGRVRGGEEAVSP